MVSMSNRLAALGLISVFLFLTACASIMHGTTQDVGISSTPTAARVLVNGQDMGTTPVIADLKRKNQHFVRIEMDGYQTYETTLTKKVSGWVWGNIVFGGLIGLAVDAITGGLYNLTPEQIRAELTRGGAEAVSLDPNHLYIFVTLTPRPEWQKAGEGLQQE